MRYIIISVLMFISSVCYCESITIDILRDNGINIPEKIHYINDDNVNFREKPEVNSRVIEKLIRGTIVVVKEQIGDILNIDKYNGRWFKVQYNKIDGYIYSKYVSYKYKIGKLEVVINDRLAKNENKNITNVFDSMSINGFLFSFKDESFNEIKFYSLKNDTYIIAVYTNTGGDSNSNTRIFAVVKGRPNQLGQTKTYIGDGGYRTIQVVLNEDGSINTNYIEMHENRWVKNNNGDYFLVTP